MIKLPLTAVVFGQFLSCQLGPPWPLHAFNSQPVYHMLLIAPLERSTCPNQRSLLSLKMRSRSSSSTFASSSHDLTLTCYCRSVQSWPCHFATRGCRLVLVNHQWPSFTGPHARASHMAMVLVIKRDGEM